MKTLGKLSINPQKVIKNEELVALRGGYDIFCTCNCYDFYANFLGYVDPDIYIGSECLSACEWAFGDGAWGFCGGNV